ncbi:hypothetical protein C8R44DRAFT_6527 [Mycena epipterygia]|nr:hypothetical protein C8R44DRAFT_6527 [Mycena epipterygia]
MASAATELVNCLSETRFGPSLSFASATLFLFEFSITFCDELRLVWFQRPSPTTILFFVARYAGMASTIVTFVQTPTTNLLLANAGTALRVIVIVASEAVLAIRTWAIWEKKRSILILLFVISAAALAGNADLIFRGVDATHVEASASDCTMIVSQESKAYLIPYGVVIAYESIIMTLSAARILKWRSQITPSARTPLLDTLWKDGLLYFSWMIVLGIVNILLIYQGGSASVRTGGAQLQTSIHSILSCRIVLHLARLPGSRQQSSEPSSLFTPTTLEIPSELSDETFGESYELG